MKASCPPCTGPGAFRQVRPKGPYHGEETKLISTSTEHLNLKSNYQSFQRYTEVDLEIAGDVEATLPYLIETCERLITGSRRRALEERGKRLAAAREWDPISGGRLYAELWEVMRDKDWASVGGSSSLWDIEKDYQTLGGGGAAAVGSRLPIAIGWKADCVSMFNRTAISCMCPERSGRLPITAFHT